jgi:hypothetical protein
MGNTMKKIKTIGSMKTAGILVVLMLVMLSFSAIAYYVALEKNNTNKITNNKDIRSYSSISYADRLFGCVICCQPARQPPSHYAPCIEKCLVTGNCLFGPVDYPGKPYEDQY